MAETELATLLTAKNPIAVTFEGDGWQEGEIEIRGGTVCVVFADGSRAQFSAVWHNDSTAGLYYSLLPPENDRG